MAKKVDKTNESEQRQFKMHSKLLYDVILRQAGSLAKAVLEGVMNSVDAGASVCRITVTDIFVKVGDNGVGFKTSEEITKWFEVFGAPHAEEEGKTFGRFRMGRGQLFAYGVNTWLTNSFKMNVDVKNEGLDYQLTKNVTPRPGCSVTVTLYDKLLPSDMQDTIISLRRWCRWAPIKVYLNDELISFNPADFADWTFELDEAWIALDDSSQLRIYNQGIFVMEFGKDKFGSGGEVVTKGELKVNFARNDIQSDCPCWKKLKPLIDSRTKDDAIKKHTLDDAERTSLRRRAARGELSFEEIQKLKIFTAVTGRNYTLSDIADYQCNYRWTVADKKGNRLGDDIHRMKMAFVLIQPVLDDMGMSAPQFQRWAEAQKGAYGSPAWYKPPTFVPFDSLTEGMTLTYELLTPDKLTVNEQIWINLLESVAHNLRLSDEDPQRFGNWVSHHRKLVLGVSDSAHGWTDAATFVAINRDFLREHLDLTLDNMLEVAALLLHEYCHRSPDTEDHDHDQAFYELFHDSARHFFGVFATKAMASLPNVLRRFKTKLTKGQLRLLDKAALVDAAKSDFSTKLSAMRPE